MRHIHRTKGSRLLVLTSAISLILSSVYLIAAPVLATEVEEQCSPASSYTDAALRDLIKLEGSTVANPQNANGSTATSWGATVAVPDNMCEVEVSFSSYTLPGGSMHPFDAQVLFDNVTSKYVGGSETGVSVDLPAGCGWQVDLYLGPVIATLNPSFGHPDAKLIDWSINQTGEVCAEEPTPNPEPEDDAALNIRKIDEDGNRLAGAVFTVEGLEGTFTTGENGHFCVTGLPDDSEWLVTEIEAPDGYEIADEASQLVQVDNDGDCNSPDAEFVNTLAEVVEPTPTPGSSEPPSQPTPTPRDGVEGGNPTPTPKGGNLPDTAMGHGATPEVPSLAFALIAIASLGMLVWLRLAESRGRP